VQLTIDSTQKLDDVIRVVSALYNVQLGVVSDADAKPAAASRSRGRSAATRGSATRRSGRRPTRRNASTAEVRAWAHTNGFTISDRGRLSQTVKNAFEASQA
jgi:Lsr2